MLDSGRLPRRRPITVSVRGHVLAAMLLVPAGLTVAVNETLDRVQTALDGQRQCADDVGHELKTPISVLRSQLELLKAQDAQQVAEIRLLATAQHPFRPAPPFDLRCLRAALPSTCATFELRCLRAKFEVDRIEHHLPFLFGQNHPCDQEPTPPPRFLAAIP